MAGYILLPRGTWKNPFFNNEPFTEREAWLWLNEHASFGKSHFIWKNNIYEITRGYYAGTITGLSKKFIWSRDRVRGFLAKLERSQLILQQKNTPFLLLSICNYGKI